LDLSWDPLLSRMASTPAPWDDRRLNAVRTAASSVPSRARARHALPASSPTSSENSRSASRKPPTAIAGTTSRPSSSAGKRATRGQAAPASPRPVDLHVLVRCLLGDQSLRRIKRAFELRLGLTRSFATLVCRLFRDRLKGRAGRTTRRNPVGKENWSGLMVLTSHFTSRAAGNRTLRHYPGQCRSGLLWASAGPRFLQLRPAGFGRLVS